MLFLHPLVLVSVAIISLEGVQSNNNQLQRVYRVITTDNVDCQPACITGSPSSDTPARSFAHCASRCTEQGCNTFNVLTDGDVEQNRGTVAKVGCQLFDEEADSANIANITGCSAYRVRMTSFSIIHVQDELTLVNIINNGL